MHLPETYEILFCDRNKGDRSKEAWQFYNKRTKLIQWKLKKAIWFFYELDFDLEKLDQVYCVMKGNKQHIFLEE